MAEVLPVELKAVIIKCLHVELIELRYYSQITHNEYKISNELRSQYHVIIKKTLN